MTEVSRTYAPKKILANVKTVKRTRILKGDKPGDKYRGEYQLTKTRVKPKELEV